MSRATEDGQHEGWVALRFADGKEHSWTSGTGVGVWPTGRLADGEEVRPYADIVAWRVACSCGWHGGVWPLEYERPENIAQGWNEPTQEREDELMLLWEAHVRSDDLRT